MGPFYTIFSILSCLRHGIPLTGLGEALKKRGLHVHPRIPFWLNLCRQAGLLNDRAIPAPTGFARQWLSLPHDAQTICLLDAFSHAPRHPQNRASRQRLLRRLKMGQPLTSKDRRELPGLQALGLCRDERLTRIGQAALGLASFPTPVSHQCWTIENGLLHISPLANWRLVWDLERWLTPCAAYMYSLDPRSLREASQQQDAEGLIAVIEAGTGLTIDPDLRAGINGQPSLRLHTAPVIEFSTSDELRQLRKSPALRPYFDNLLSPRLARIDPQDISRLLPMLERRGIFVKPLQEEPPEPADPKPETVHWRSDNTETDLLQALHWSLRTQSAIDILYRAPNAERPELRRITPLLIEDRGGREYVLAYCHTRRGQRTFRLDRMELGECAI